MNYETFFMGVNLMVAIVGVGDTEMGKLPNLTSIELQALAAKKAIADAGMNVGEIDGIISSYTLSEPHPMPSTYLAEYLGLQPEFNTAMQLGGASGCAAVGLAQAVIKAGYCQNVLISFGENRLTGLGREDAIKRLSTFGHPQFEAIYGPTIPSFYALIAKRYLEEFHVTSEDLARVAVLHREHALLHPHAHMKKPISIDDVLTSKWIAEPLHLLDCALISDGGSAIIVTSKENSRSFKKKPIHLLGYGEKTTHEHIFQKDDFRLFGSVESGKKAFKIAGVTPNDIDVALLYDCFTITVLILLEDLGFCQRGEAVSLLKEGKLKLGGKLPVNPHGGLLSHGQPGTAGGLNHVIEAVRQLRHEADKRQVADANLALVHGNGGVMSVQSTLILGRDSR
ncbi:acetyl-CoA acetyltransferase [Halalkalibacter nanhaiisediminis]|uniref:Acetyl-CoA acetyltransferase n=2 Tax=Halalkalibacter nanhaiisediminis TaxID=688079 RepID=A0A562QD83_9BACI|nr:acetyl-CoA acetyltransferase [Halalkalibacter nanhaiisediminis]